MIKFTGYNIFLQHFRADKGMRITIDVSQSEYKNLLEVPAFPQAVYEITIKPIINEETV